MEEVISVPFKMIWTMVKRGFVTQRHIIIPFIIAVSIMFGIEYILLSITFNPYLMKQQPSMRISAIIGNVLMSMLTLIFLMYANNFVINQRKKEYALNMILGMEKKHLRSVILLELVVQFLVSAVLSIVGGYLFGQLLFMSINKIIGIKQPNLSDYPFDSLAMIITLSLLLALMFLLFIINNFKVSLKKPLKTIEKSKMNERKIPKVLIIIITIIGILTIGYGYYLALKPNTTLGSIANLFIAIFSVLVGTYCLFISIGTVFLERLQKIKQFYYKPYNFFFLAGLKSRIKSNSIGLATICFICTFLIVTLSMTISTYRNLDGRLDQILPNDYSGYYYGDYLKEQSLRKQIKNLEKDVHKYAPTDSFKVYATDSIKAVLKGNNQHKIVKKADSSYGNLDLNKKTNLDVFMNIYNLTDYNKYNKKLKLSDNEVAISTKVGLFKKFKTLRILGKTYKVKHINSTNIDNVMYTDSMIVIVKNRKLMYDIVKSYNNPKSNNKKIANVIKSSVEFNAMKNKKVLNKHLDKIGPRNKTVIHSKEDYKNVWIQINGNLIFIGSLVSFVLLIGIFLMLYYKQVSEGYEDREEFRTMRQVGLDEHLIKKTINKQVIWVFLIPIIIAIIHSLAAFRIIHSLLGVEGIFDIGLFATSYLGVVIAIIAIYSLMYWVTSRIYYMIINNKH